VVTTFCLVAYIRRGVNFLTEINNQNSAEWVTGCIIIIINIIIINDIYRAQTSPRSKCAKSAVAQ